MSTIIDPAKAKSLIQEYKDQNAAAGDSAIKTTTGDNLHGYFLDRDSLEKILSNPEAKGVSLHLAKHPDSVGAADNHYTVLYTGAKDSAAKNPTTKYESTGPIYGGTPPCPFECTALS